MPGGKCGLFLGIEKLRQSAEYKQREAENNLLRDVGRDRLLELVRAKKENRLAVLPCEVGNLLYEVDSPKYGVITCKVIYIGYYIGPERHIPGEPMVQTATVGVEVIEGHGKGSAYEFETKDFGKIVFMSRKEAEAALKEQEG